MSLELKVITLNCWGLPVPISKFLHQRISAISEELSQGEFDIILLQEIWNQSDFNKIKNKLATHYPYSHYFHSGMFGCGVCIFSKYPILETFLHRFSLNGYAHRIFHGDWFSGKAVGLAKLLCGKFIVNVYATHIHADYSEQDYLYGSHRVVQAYELGQFIRHTSEGCHAVILGGDLNYNDMSIGYKMIVSNGNLYDAWMTNLTPIEGDTGNTCNCLENSFTPCPGKDCRIDYLFFRNNPGCSMVCNKCWTTMNKIPGQKFSYSDHQAVAAIFNVKKEDSNPGKTLSYQEIEEVFHSAIPIIDEGMKKASVDRMFYIASMVLCSMLLVLSGWVSLPFGLDVTFSIIRTVITIAIGALFWMGVVLSWQELNGFLAAKKDINNLLLMNSVMQNYKNT